jgi:hypothetical protein
MDIHNGYQQCELRISTIRIVDIRNAIVDIRNAIVDIRIVD